MILSRVHESILSDHWVNTSLSSCRLLLFSPFSPFSPPADFLCSTWSVALPGQAPTTFRSPLKLAFLATSSAGRGRTSTLSSRWRWVSSAGFIFSSLHRLFMFSYLFIFSCVVSFIILLSPAGCVFYSSSSEMWLNNYRNTVSTAASV